MHSQLLLVVVVSAISLIGCAGDLPAGPPPARDVSHATFLQVSGLVDAYAAAHEGKARDINRKTPAELGTDDDARELLAICGDDQRPVIPALAWEYGGHDHAWIDSAASALAYCVYVPVASDTSRWGYDRTQQLVTADVYVRFPEENPCDDRPGREQIAACIGRDSNFEILIDTASFADGSAAGLSLAEASTDLELITDDGEQVKLVTAS